MGVCLISALQSIWDGFDVTYLLSILLSVIPALLCITLHELSHGLVAYKLGDSTAKDRGRLTLNPIRHLDPIGLLMMVTFHVGWAKPVPVNMRNFQNPKRGMALTALAGPVCNVLITLVFLFLFGAASLPLGRSDVGGYLLQMLQLTARISLGLAIFNLIPIPPLDGSKVLLSVLSDENYWKLMRYERYGSLLMLLLVSTGILGRPLSAVINSVYSSLFPIARGAYALVFRLFYS